MAQEEILVVEDNPTNLKLVTLLLTADHYKVHVAVDAKEALEVLAHCKPQLILMDIQLPLKNGLELTRELKSDPRYQDIIIIALTAYAMKGDEEKARAAGCDGYLTKPISIANFSLQIATFLKKTTKEFSPIKGVPEKIRILIVEDNPISRKALKLTLKSANYLVSEAIDGASALTMVENHTFDLIIQDLFLPDMEGFALNKKIREFPQAQEIPIFALSGFLSPIHKESEHNGFSTFLLKPIEPSYLLDVVKAHLPITTLPDPEIKKGKLILIVDDNPIQLKLFNMQLKNAGFEITCAKDGIDALAVMQHVRPDAIISDILMPNMDGFSLCVAVKRDPQLSAIPVMLLSSHYLEDDDLQLAKNVGASCYLTRTPNEEYLLSELSKILKEKISSTAAYPHELSNEIKEQHTIRTIRQLEQQVANNTQLAQRYSMLKSQLAIISGIANSLTSNNKDIDDSLREVLYFCLDATGLSKGALYLMKSDGKMRLSHQMGFRNDQRETVEQFFGLSSLILKIAQVNEPFAIPSNRYSEFEAHFFLKEAQIKSALFIPLFSGKDCLGILFLGSDLSSLSNEIAREFIRALAIQFSQSIALASTFDKLSSSENRYRQIVEISPYAILIYQHKQFVYANQSAINLFSATNAKELMDQPLDKFFPPKYLKIVQDNLALSKEQLSSMLPQGKITNLKGDILDVDVVVSHFLYHEEPAVYMIIRDITQSAHSQLQLEVQYAIAWILAESATLYVATAKILKIVCERMQWDCGVIWAVDQKANVLRCSRVWQTSLIKNEEFQLESQLLAIPPGEGLLGQVWNQRIAIWRPEMSHDELFLRKNAALKIGLKTGVAFPIIYENEVLGVIEFFSRKIISPRQDILLWFESIGNQFGLFLKRKHMENQMLFLAEHDVLTGLANRSLLEQYLQSTLEVAKEKNQKLTLLFLDLDHFKYVNDSLGHQTGDILLKEIAERLLTCFRPQDIVSRVGGDEFVIVLPEIYKKKDIIEIIKRVHDQFSSQINLVDKQYLITVSIGISCYPKDGDTVHGLIKGADIAMYAAKDKGRNNFQFCTPEMTQKAENKGILQNNLRLALEHKEFILYYQPKIDVLTQKIIGMEGLIRWQKPDGIILPSQFISAIESCDLIIPVSEWVLKTACLQNKAWQNQGLPDIVMSVNLSVRNFNHQLLRVIERILEESELNPESLEIELTESVLMDNVENNIFILNSLKDMGLKISIDDFGTGYSSLSYLKRFPIDIIKIDKSFINDIETGPSGTAIIIAIIAMSHSLGFKVIAEGVETEAQLKFLSENGCDEIQGYYFSSPLDVIEATHFIKSANIAEAFRFLHPH